MFVDKAINNNVVSITENNIEKIILGSGLGFKKKSGDLVDESKIELTPKSWTNQLKEVSFLWQNIVQNLNINW